MDKEAKFEPGDWIGARGGIGQVLECNNVYYEERDFEVAAGQQSLGALRNIIVVYKLFSDFDYVPRKRERLRSCTNSLCRHLEKEELKSVKKSIDKNKNSYEKYLMDTDYEWHGQWWLHDGLIHPQDFSLYEDKCKTISCALGSDFILPDFIHCLYRHSMPVPVVPEPTRRHDDFGNLHVRIFNKLFRSKDKRAIYTEFKYEILNKYTITGNEN